MRRGRFLTEAQRSPCSQTQRDAPDGHMASKGKTHSMLATRLGMIERDPDVRALWEARKRWCGGGDGSGGATALAVAPALLPAPSQLDDENRRDREEAESAMDVQWLEQYLFFGPVADTLKATVWMALTVWFWATRCGHAEMAKCERFRKRRRRMQRLRRCQEQLERAEKRRNGGGGGQRRPLRRQRPPPTTTRSSSTRLGRLSPSSVEDATDTPKSHWTLTKGHRRQVEVFFLELVQKLYGFSFASLVQDSCHYGDVTFKIFEQPVAELAKRAERLRGKRFKLTTDPKPCEKLDVAIHAPPPLPGEEAAFRHPSDDKERPFDDAAQEPDHCRAYNVYLRACFPKWANLGTLNAYVHPLLPWSDATASGERQALL